MVRILGPLLMSLCLSSCMVQQTVQQDFSQDYSQWELQQIRRAELKSWILSGKVSVTQLHAKKNPLTFRIKWEHREDTDSLLLSDSFGLQSVKIVQSAVQAIAYSSKNEILMSAPTVLALSTKILGVAIDLDRLKAGLMGIDFSQTKYESFNLLQDGLLMAKKIIHTQSAISITMIITLWELPKQD
ncbi:MAG: lipoprotein insertase outer membrane protein LolB [Methylacidiphilales bacterium]|nr:lipoprotein insertase outer membrane protein LolB [Candidatus Methylacidiphilales bacterium]